MSGDLKKCISLSLFGYKNEHKDCISFNTFLKFFSINLRAWEFVFNDWDIVLHIDKLSYDSHISYFNVVEKIANLKIKINESSDLCKNMLWRLEPVDEYDYTICRDIDSLPTFREKLCVNQWISDGTKAHSINDSVSHNIELMGGMIGFTKNSFSKDLLNISYNFKDKGSDQTFLNQHILPIVNNSITHHRFLGFEKQNENTFSRNFIDTNEIYKDELKLRADNLCNHIGQSGFHLEKTYNNLIDRHYEGAVPFYLKVVNDKIKFSKELYDIEKEFKNIFYWAV